MTRTIADGLCDEGRKETLLELLKEKFGAVPGRVVQKIRRTKESRLIDTWVKRILTASSLDEMQILPPE